MFSIRSRQKEEMLVSVKKDLANLNHPVSVYCNHVFMQTIVNCPVMVVSTTLCKGLVVK